MFDDHRKSFWDIEIDGKKLGDSTGTLSRVFKNPPLSTRAPAAVVAPLLRPGLSRSAARLSWRPGVVPCAESERPGFSFTKR